MKKFTPIQSDVIFNTLTWAAEYDAMMSRANASLEARKSNKRMQLATEANAFEEQHTERNLAKELLAELFNCTVSEICREYKNRI